MAGISELDQRSRAILQQVIDLYVETGEPVGSRTLSSRLGLALSPASIRAVMAGLEEMGLLTSPHISAGRVPTEAGLRLFIDGLLEIGDIGADERATIESRCATRGRSFAEALEEASQTLAGLSRCAGLVTAPKADRPLRQMEFVNLGDGRLLIVLVTEDGMVENRVIDLPETVPAAALLQATNYLNSRLRGRPLADVRAEVEVEISTRRAQLDALTAQVVARGLAVWSETAVGGHLILKGQAQLLEDVTALADLERIRTLFEQLEGRETVVRLLDQTSAADGVQIFIGAENALFAEAGCSMVVAPYRDGKEQIVGAIGVIGPTRLNYARIIPMVDYTSRVLTRLLSGKENP